MASQMPTEVREALQSLDRDRGRIVHDWLNERESKHSRALRQTQMALRESNQAASYAASFQQLLKAAEDMGKAVERLDSTTDTLRELSAELRDVKAAADGARSGLMALLSDPSALWAIARARAPWIVAALTGAGGWGASEYINNAQNNAPQHVVAPPQYAPTHDPSAPPGYHEPRQGYPVPPVPYQSHPESPP